jgi:hypothetical protein
MGTLTLGTLTFGQKQITQLNEAYKETAFKNPAITDNHTVQENIVSNEQIAILGRITKFTRKDAGAGLGAQTKVLNVSEKQWSPVDLKMWVQMKQQEWKQTFAVWMSNKGLNRNDMTNVEFAQFVLEMLTNGSLEDAIRIAWLAATDAAGTNYSPSGVLTSGVDVEDYDQFDGLFDQAFAIGAASSSRYTEITNNALGTRAAQYNLGSTVARDTFKAMWDNADSRMWSNDPQLLVTRTLYRNWVNYLNSQPIQGSWETLQSGIKVPLYEGIRVIPMDIWDRYLLEDFSDGTKIYKPHRAILTPKTNVRIGVDLLNGIQDFEVFFDKMSETNNFRGLYRMDAKLIEDGMVQIAH